MRAGFGYRLADELVTAAAPLEGSPDVSLDTMSWRLLQQTAAVLGLEVVAARRARPHRADAGLPRHAGAQPAAPWANPGWRAAANSQPLAGRHVLALAPRREMRGLVREALRPMGLLLDFVATRRRSAPALRRRPAARGRLRGGTGWRGLRAPARRTAGRGTAARLHPHRRTGQGLRGAEPRRPPGRQRRARRDHRSRCRRRCSSSWRAPTEPPLTRATTGPRAGRSRPRLRRGRRCPRRTPARLP
ncbi:MAG: hypothetical protein MZW92_27870 [Comamonadaceae bacterium]|nr:hypothetical protein [Comamonadaceae bacterium]